MTDKQYESQKNLSEIINRLANEIFKTSKIPSSYFTLDLPPLSDECEFELLIMENEKEMKKILKKYCL